MNTSDKYLLHTIDAATLKGSRNRHSGHWLGTFAILAFVGAVIVVLLWADRAFV